jgi:hypothetical protein
MTEDEHIKLVEIGNAFWRAFSKLCVEYIEMMPPELRDEARAYLGEKTSVYGINENE